MYNTYHADDRQKLLALKDLHILLSSVLHQSDLRRLSVNVLY